MRGKSFPVFWASVPAAFVLAALAALLAPFKLYLVAQLSVVIIVTSAMTVLLGAAGLLSLASAAFMALGGFGLMIAVNTLLLPFGVSIVVVALLAAAVGAVLGLVSLRISGFHLAIVTFGFLQTLQVLLKRGGTLTGGGYGLVVPPIDLPLVGNLTTSKLAIASVFLMVLVVGACAALMRSRVGRAWLALRDNESAARMQGIDVSRMKVLAFSFASAIIALAGMLHVLLLGVANPNAYLIDLSIFHITLVVVGGMTGSLVGAVIAPAILFYLPEVFHWIGEWRDVFYGTVLLLTLVFMPQGVGPAVIRLTRLLRQRLVTQ